MATNVLRDGQKDGNKHSTQKQISFGAGPDIVPWCSGLKIVITGGCGFLGLHIARLLYMESSDVYITLMDIKPLNIDMMTFITGQTTNGARLHHCKGSVLVRDNLRKAFKDADIVIHCADKSEKKISSDINEMMQRVNIEGTENVVHFCKLSGVKCLVNVGTIFQAIYNGIPYQEGIHEDTPIREGAELIMDTLGTSKNIAEKKVLDANGELTGGEKPEEKRKSEEKKKTEEKMQHFSRGISEERILYTCSIRTPPLYGENDTTLIPSAAYVANKFFGCYPRIGKKSVHMNVMYVENAAHAIVCAARKLTEKGDKVGGKFYYVTDDTKFTNYSDFFGHFLDQLGYRVNLNVRLPVKLVTFWLYMILTILVFVMIFFDVREMAGLLLRYHHQAKVLTVSHSFSREKARRVLGYEPIITFELASNKSLNYYFREHIYRRN